ncbi:DUF3006 domain-containing protein [Halapricum hydrolyticum]|uniref:DUF3006 domain-containing protein n=1 Tax=Halapricum hydrolyticum TaxID=2979991 RepID=A0AAE3IH56_9EURY|nr:DUF3006 domain-containing protein [Halapricum hydrolyticum]MCU4719678.1 DUF3006 domain-containing protein [Halapricum hydrolyticum]MCU4728599.1 DUF3006 domain-containing protein [Halapricum hydrolyticum]
MTNEPLSGTYTAVLDRFEDELAVLLIEDDGDVVSDVTIERSDLPQPGRHQDAIFDVEFEDGEVVSVVYDSETTEKRSRAAQSRFDRLSRRLPDDEDE